MDRCPDCNYSLAIHFRRGAGTRVGEFLGCPVMVSARLGLADAHPRVSFRVITWRGDRYDAGAVDRKGHIVATWADYQDDAGNVLFWDLDNGDQWMGDREAMKLRTRKTTNEEAYQARQRLQDDIGGPVRVVASIRRTKDQEERSENPA